MATTAKERYDAQRWVEDLFVSQGVKETRLNVPQILQELKENTGITVSRTAMERMLHDFGITTPRMREIQRSKAKAEQRIDKLPLEKCDYQSTDKLIMIYQNFDLRLAKVCELIAKIANELGVKID